MVEDFTSSERKVLVDTLLRWFATAMRPLPWRENYTPYGVWISEIMLQQTQMERGVRYFNNWMRLFPDLRAVASADEEAILSAWEGLGYYSRARNLHAAAKRIVAEHGGEFPRSPHAIRALPGVGEYTAGAIASIAFNIPEPAVDANVLRIFARLRDIDRPVTSRDVGNYVTEMVRAILAEGAPRFLTQGLMEFGALVCTKKPRCNECPLVKHCAAHRAGTVAERPLKTAKAGYALLETAAGIVRRNGRFYVRKRPLGGLWAGLWEFPGGTIEKGETPESAALRHVLREAGVSASIREKIGIVRHGYTTNRVTMHGFLCEAADEACMDESSSTNDGAWVQPAELRRFAFAAGHRKLLERLGWK